MNNTGNCDRKLRENVEIRQIQLLKRKLSKDDIIMELANLHNLVCDISDCVQLYFGYSVVLIMILNFYHLVFHSYFILEILFIPLEYFKNWNIYEMLSAIFAQVFIATFQLIILVEICNKNVWQNKLISKNIHKILNKNITYAVEERLKLFALQWRNRPLQFMAAGIFPLDRTLYLTVSFVLI